MYSVSRTLTSLLTLALLATAHFQIQSPPPRGYSEDTLSAYPCGGQNTPSVTRSMFPTSGGPIQLNMEHDRSEVQVNIAMGSDAVDGNAFNVTLMPIALEEGIGKFCLGAVMIPSSLGVKDGQNATIQVITSGDPQGGLYNCADITFSSTAKVGPCSNGTGVTVTAFTGTNKNANGSDSSTAGGTSPGTSPSPTGSHSGADMLSVRLGGIAFLSGGIAMGALL